MVHELFEDSFKLFKEVIEKHGITQGNTHNMDERGCMLGIGEAPKVLVLSKAKPGFIQQPGTRESVTMIECGGGDRAGFTTLHHLGGQRPSQH